MKLQIGENIISICKEIQESSWTEAEWSQNESCDWFQYGDIIGGYDAKEKVFLFSYHDTEGEWRLQFSLSDVPKILNGDIEYLTLTVPKRC